MDFEAAPDIKNKATKKSLVSRNRLIACLTYHAMMMPAAILLIAFFYVPMLGSVIAFEDFNPVKGIFGSRWVGLDNFAKLFTYNDLGRVLFNTVYIASMKIVANLVVPITFALLLNELKKKYFVRTVQTMIYLPYFLSWVLLSGIIIDLLSPSDGIVNMMIKSLGMKPVYFLGDKTIFPYLLVVTDIWKNFGFGTIVFFAALTSIDATMYEAALMDGANRWQQVIHVTLPGISQIIVLMTVLSIGGIMDAGFDQVFNLYNPMVYETGDIIDTLVYRMGLLDMNFSLSTAVGLFKSSISMVLIMVSYKLADKYAGYRIF